MTTKNKLVLLKLVMLTGFCRALPD